MAIRTISMSLRWRRFVIGGEPGMAEEPWRALFFEWSEKELERNDKAKKGRERKRKRQAFLRFSFLSLSDVIVGIKPPPSHPLQSRPRLS